MGSRRKLPETAQLNLLPDSDAGLSQSNDCPCPLDHFLQGDPQSIFIGDKPLKKYLIDSGKGWVIRFRELLFKQDATPFLKAYKSIGRKPYHPFVILGLILYGAQQGRWSLRNLEDLSQLDLGAWWICGGQQPDHSTIGDFINMHSELLTEEFFITLTADLVKCLKLSRSTVAGDGTVIEAASSRFSMLKSEAAEQALIELEKKSGRDSKQVKQCREVMNVVKKRDEERKKKGRGKNGARVCPKEPEAVLQPRKDGVKRPSYKPSVLADQNRMILGQHVNGASEMAAVSPMLEQYHDIFGSLPLRSLWDGNYNKFELLETSIALDMDVLCGVKHKSKKSKPKKLLKSDFIYDSGQDLYHCPAGNHLVYRKSGFGKDRTFREYQCRNCDGCELRKGCTKAKAGRSIIRYEGEELKETMREIMTHPAAKKKFRHRQAMVEPVFGMLRYQQGLSRFHRKGLANVRVEFSLHCMAYNLRRALRLEGGATGLLCSLSANINGQKTFWSATLAIFWTKNKCFIFLLENENEKLI